MKHMKFKEASKKKVEQSENSLVPSFMCLAKTKRKEESSLQVSSKIEQSLKPCVKAILSLILAYGRLLLIASFVEEEL